MSPERRKFSFSFVEMHFPKQKGVGQINFQRLLMGVLVSGNRSTFYENTLTMSKTLVAKATMSSPGPVCLKY